MLRGDRRVLKCGATQGRLNDPAGFADVSVNLVFHVRQDLALLPQALDALGATLPGAAP